MAEYVLNGRVIAVAAETQIESKVNPGTMIKRRQLYLDCSRYDSLTGEKLNDNTPLLDFGGKGLEQLNALVSNGLKKGDIVSVKFAVDGRNYKDAQGKTKNFTGIRPYAIELYQRPQRQQTQQVAQPATQQPTQYVVQQAAPQPQPVVQQQEQPTDDGLPF